MATAVVLPGDGLGECGLALRGVMGARPWRCFVA